VERGCRRISWQDWLRLAGDETARSKISPHDAIAPEAHVALADAQTERTAAILLDQLHGALSDAIRQVLAAIRAADWSQARANIEMLIDRSGIGLHLTTPWRVVLAGAPNVGKSSLMNRLAGFERAIVSPLAGTTRDVLTTMTAVDGWPVELIDMAGLRTTGDDLEAAGVSLAMTTLQSADLVLAVTDVTQLDSWQAISDADITSHVIRVVNKIDLVPQGQRAKLSKSIPLDRAARGELQLVSALTGENVAGLVIAIGRALVPDFPPAGAAVPFTLEQRDALTSARDAIDRRDAELATAILQALLAGKARSADASG
jgi:tRNA modification GTPase